MNETSSGQKAEILQRDKELRARILGEFFSRITWVDAGGIVLITAFVADHTLPGLATWLAKVAVILFAVSLGLALYVPLRRHDAAFDRSRRDKTGFRLQKVSAALTGAALLVVAIGALTL